MAIGETWVEAIAIVGAWPSVGDAERAAVDTLAGCGRAAHAEHRRGRNIARVYDVGGAGWVSAATALVIELARTLAAPRIFGVGIEYGPSGNSALSVTGVELAIDGDALVEISELGTFPNDRDALDAGLAWEIRFAARTVGLDTEDVPSRGVYYDDW